MSTVGSDSEIGSERIKHEDDKLVNYIGHTSNKVSS